MNRVIQAETPEGADYSIQPHDIDTSSQFLSSFGDSETEEAARMIVMLCQRKNGWHPFTKLEINAFTGSDFDFGTLIPLPGIPSANSYIVIGRHGRHFVTEEFILKCYESSPVRTSDDASSADNGEKRFDKWHGVVPKVGQVVQLQFENITLETLVQGRFTENGETFHIEVSSVFRPLVLTITPSASGSGLPGKPALRPYWQDVWTAKPNLPVLGKFLKLFFLN